MPGLTAVACLRLGAANVKQHHNIPFWHGKTSKQAFSLAQLILLPVARYRLGAGTSSGRLPLPSYVCSSPHACVARPLSAWRTCKHCIPSLPANCILPASTPLPNHALRSLWCTAMVCQSPSMTKCWPQSSRPSRRCVSETGVDFRSGLGCHRCIVAPAYIPCMQHKRRWRSIACCKVLRCYLSAVDST